MFDYHMELNTLSESLQANFYFPIPQSLIAGQNLVSETVKEFMEFLKISAYCIGDDSNIDWSEFDLPEANDTSDEATRLFHEKINTINNTMQIMSMKLTLMNEEIKIQQSSVRLNYLMCVLVTSDQRPFFKEILFIHFYLCFGSILVMVTFHMYPFLPFTLRFFGNVVYIFVYDKLTGKAFKVRDKIWTFKIIEESKNGKIKKPDKMSILLKYQKLKICRKYRKRN